MLYITTLCYIYPHYATAVVFAYVVNSAVWVEGVG